MLFQNIPTDENLGQMERVKRYDRNGRARQMTCWISSGKRKIIYRIDSNSLRFLIRSNIIIFVMISNTRTPPSIHRSKFSALLLFGRRSRISCMPTLNNNGSHRHRSVKIVRNGKIVLNWMLSSSSSSLPTVSARHHISPFPILPLPSTSLSACMVKPEQIRAHFIRM